MCKLSNLISIIIIAFFWNGLLAQCSPDAGSDVTIDCNTPSTMLTATGGVSYIWSPIDGLDNPTSATPIASPATTTIYTVTVTGTDLCTGTASVTVTVDKDEPIADAGINDTVNCLQTSVTLNGSGGDTYLWSPSTGLSDVNVPNPIATPTTSQTYQLTVTGSNGCTNSVPSEITVMVDKDEPIADAGMNVTIDCNSPSAILNGTGGVDYSWSPATGLSDPSIFNPAATPAATQTYQLTVTGQNGCTNSVPSEITVTVDKDEPIADAGINDTVNCLQTSVTLNGSGGDTYLWSPSTGLSDVNVPNPIATPMSTQIYSLMVTGANGCTLSMPVQVEIAVDNSPPIVSAGMDITNNCYAPKDTIRATGGLAYSWSPSTGLDDPNRSNPEANPTVTQTYTVLATASNGCTASDDVTVTVDKDPPVANAGPDFGTTCAALNAQLQASGGVFYVWNNGNTLSDDSIPNPIAAPPTTTTYTVTVTGANGCTDTDQTTVTLNDITPSAIAGDDQDICGQYVATMNPDVSGNSTSDYFAWQGDPLNPTQLNFSDFNDPNTEVSNFQEGTYTIYWTVSNNVCPPVQDTLIVSIYNEPVSNAGLDDSLCGSDNIALNADLPVGTSSGEWTLDSSFPNANSSLIVFSDSSSHNTIVSGLEEGKYQFVWTVTNGNCPPARDTVKISVFNQPIANAGINDSLCAFYTYELDAVPTVGTSEGFWSEDVSFTNPSTVNFTDSSINTTSVNGLIEGTYQFVWETFNGNCPRARDTVSISVFDLPIANAGADQSVCGVDSLFLDTLEFLMADVPAGTSSGMWSVDNSFANPSTAEFLEEISPNSPVTKLLEGTHQFIWTVLNGTCSAVSDVVQITAFDSPFVDAGQNQSLCAEDEVLMSAASPIGTSDGVWSIDANFSNPSVISFDMPSNPTTNSTGYEEGVYQLIWTVTNSNCPAKDDTVQIFIYDQPIANVGDTIKVCDTNNVSFMAEDPIGLSNGFWSEDNTFTNPSTITFLNDSLNTTQSSGYVEGTYQFVWTVENGVCNVDRDTLVITNSNQPVAYAGEDQVLCEVDTIQLNGGGNLGTAIGRWELDSNHSYSSIPTFRDSSDSNTIGDNFTGGEYPLVFVVENGICNASYDTVIIINKLKPIADWEFPSKACDNRCFNIASLSDHPENLLLSYEWFVKDEEYTDSLSIVCIDEAGLYDIKLIVTASNGCQDSLQEFDTIVVHPAPFAGFEMEFQDDSLLELQRLDVISSASEDVIDFQYSLGNGDTLNEENLIYIYREYGDYEITQWVENQFGCRDSIWKGRRVGKRRAIYVPNSFTPNGDGINDTFGPVSRDLSEDFYEFTISNRLGKKVFESNNVYEKWDGRVDGKLVQDGTFIWSLRYLFKGEIEVRSKEGFVIISK